MCLRVAHMFTFWRMHFGCVCACARGYMFVMRMRWPTRNMISVCTHAWIGMPPCSRRSPTKSKAIYFAWSMRWVSEWPWPLFACNYDWDISGLFVGVESTVSKFFSLYQLAPPTWLCTRIHSSTYRPCIYAGLNSEAHRHVRTAYHVMTAQNLPMHRISTAITVSLYLRFSPKKRDTSNLQSQSRNSPFTHSLTKFKTQFQL